MLVKKLNEAVIKLLLANGASKNIKNSEGKLAEELLDEKSYEIKAMFK